MALKVDRLRKLREKHGLSQRELAKYCGVSSTQIRNYENSVSDPTSDKLVAMADIFGVSIDYLTGRTDDPGVPFTGHDLDQEEQTMVSTYRREGWTGVIRLGAEKISK